MRFEDWAGKTQNGGTAVNTGSNWGLKKNSETCPERNLFKYGKKSEKHRKKPIS